MKQTGTNDNKGIFHVEKITDRTKKIQRSQNLAAKMLSTSPHLTKT